MRIPIYRSQVGLTTEAPGRPFTARKSAQPFVRQALAKSAPFEALTKEVGEYSIMRVKMINEAKRNEAIFAAKEGLLTAVDEFESDKNPYDIFNEDGTGRWSETVERLRKEMRLKVGRNREELAAFDNAFSQAELSLRFKLKDTVDARIEKMRQAALDARNDQFIAKWSNPFANPQTFGLENAENTAMLQQAVANGGINPQIVQMVGAKNLDKITENVVEAYAGTDPNRVFALATYLDLLDEATASGELDATAIARIEGLPLPNSEWTRTILASVDRGKAREVLAKVMTAANKFESYRKKQSDKVDKNRSDTLDRLKLLTFSSDTDGDNPIYLEGFLDKYKSVLGQAMVDEIDAKKSTTLQEGEAVDYIEGSVLREVLKPFLLSTNQLTLDEQAKLEKKIEAGPAAYASVDNQDAVDRLTRMIETSDNFAATRTYLEDSSPFLTAATYAKFDKDLDAAERLQQSNLRTELDRVISYVRDELNFVDRDNLTSSERVSNQSAKKVSAALKRMVLEGNVTEDQILDEADKLIKAEKTAAKKQLMPLYRAQLTLMNGNNYFRGAISPSSVTPLEDLQARLEQILAENPNLGSTVEPYYNTFYANIYSFVERGLFDE